MTHRRLLLVLLAILVAIPQPLAYVSTRDNIEGFQGLAIFGVLFDVLFVFVFIDGLRGSRFPMNFLAGFNLVLGGGCLIAAFFVQNGPFQLAASGLSAIGIAIALILLRDEVQAERRHATDHATV